MELENALTHHRGDMRVTNPCVEGSVVSAFSPTMRSTSLEDEYPLNSYLHTPTSPGHVSQRRQPIRITSARCPLFHYGKFPNFVSSIQRFAAYNNINTFFIIKRLGDVVYCPNFCFVCHIKYMLFKIINFII